MDCAFYPKDFQNIGSELSSFHEGLFTSHWKVALCKRNRLARVACGLPTVLAPADRGGPKIAFLPTPQVGAISFRTFEAAERVGGCHSRVRNECARAVKFGRMWMSRPVKQKL